MVFCLLKDIPMMSKGLIKVFGDLYEAEVNFILINPVSMIQLSYFCSSLSLSEVICSTSSGRFPALTSNSSRALMFLS